MALAEASASPPHRLHPAAEASRHDRDTSRDALHTLEDALSEPAPGREAGWLARVNDALETLAQALDAQAGRDSESASILSEIATDEPRLSARVQRLRHEHQDLRDSVRSLQAQLSPQPAGDVDVADIRDRLAAVARRLRQHRAREADLIYEATSVNLGVGD